MVTTANVRQVSESLKPNIAPIIPRNGVVTLFGYGIQVRVDRGHLILDDGIGSSRRQGRFPRVRHGLRRLVVVGSDGIVSLAALRWLSDQKASFVMIERDGSVLVTTGPARSSDANLRRAQALAQVSGVALRITRELIRQKLTGQELVARNKLLDTTTADAIATFSAELPRAEHTASLRLIEAQAASAYWSAWRTLPLTFPKKDLPRVPVHWRSFGTRVSPLTGSPRLAVTPGCAMMNYLYALLESEASLAARALGLDASIGIFHVDQPNRDSLACDLMEPVRPQVDAFLLDWITTQPLKREWFFEQPNGNARLMSSLTEKLAETAPTWARAVAPVAEWVAQALWSSAGRSTSKDLTLPTRLTQRHRSEGRGSAFVMGTNPLPRREKICEVCGTEGIKSRYCHACAVEASRENMAQVALIGHSRPKTQRAKERISKRISTHAVANTWWDPKTLPSWLTEKCYVDRIQPLLRGKKVREIAEAMHVSQPYAAFIRSGRRRPHPRHWETLAKLAGIGDASNLTLNPYCSSASSCSNKHDPSGPVDYAQVVRINAHESATNSKTN
jgi:CRISPR-associated endonuclease Cas1